MIKTDIDLIKDRAFIELDLDNLDNNIEEIKKYLKPKSKIMAVIKANAYGHGMTIIAKHLEEIGISNFAVATVEEAIELREENIKGNILILGYTDFKNLHYVKEYDLIQTIVDYNYAKTIEEMAPSFKIKAHIKINTGMNRIGENISNIDKIAGIFENKYLEIKGVFGHLSASDSNNLEDVSYTNDQISKFMDCVNKLKEMGYNFEVHLQSSYGFLNYNELDLDYVRIGIIMYGVNNSKYSYNKIKLNLKPVLSLKARITSIREIEKNTDVGYGRTYTSDSKRLVASVSIGYADGFPRALGNKDATVKIGGGYAKIIGRICMDQLMIDITDIKDVKVGDYVTLIGEEEEISSVSVADRIDTITNELLSRLGARLARIIKTNK